MAIWHFQITLIPDESPEMAGLIGDSDPRIRPLFESGSFSWTARATSVHAFIGHTSLNFKQVDWCETIWLTGREDSDHIKVFTTDEQIVETVEVMIDARGSYMQLIAQVIELATKLRCVLLIMPGKLLKPNAQDVVDALRSSSAWLWQRDPEGALKGMKPLDNGIS